jgi:hypothetical protein
MCGIPIQKSTPLACVHHMSCDAGAGAVERQHSFIYVFSSIFLLLRSSTTYMKSFVCGGLLFVYPKQQ